MEEGQDTRRCSRPQHGAPPDVSTRLLSGPHGQPGGFQAPVAAKATGPRSWRHRKAGWHRAGLPITEGACKATRPGAGAGGQRQSRAWVLENSDGSQETARHWCDKAASKAGPRPRTEKEDSRTAALLTRHPQRGRGLVSVLPTRQQREGMSRSSTRIMTCPRNAISQNSENRA